MPIRRKTLEEYFWARVEKSDGCWRWTGMASPSGYGQIILHKGAARVWAHIASWQMQHSQAVPSGMKVRHVCGERTCVRPDHLLLDTPRSMKNSRGLVSLADLKADLNYDPLTGLFTWKAKRPGIVQGGVAGRVDNTGYRSICLRYRPYLAHRLAWFYMTGKWTKVQIDHIDLNRDNNAFANLREASGSQNQCNQRAHRDNKSGFKGVSRTSEGKRWRAAIKVNGKVKHLGSFATAEEAHLAYCKAAIDGHGEFARTE